MGNTVDSERWPLILGCLVKYWVCIRLRILKLNVHAAFPVAVNEPFMRGY